MEITFIDETQKVSKNEREEIDRLLQYAADYLKLPENSEMSITFMDNERIQVINRDYRGKDAPTDVISFAIEEAGQNEMPIFFDDEKMTDLPNELGDIMISTQRAQEQAAEYGHSYEREVGFLALHGFLHINGYDHMTLEDEKKMFGLQKEILNAYGLKR
ncbi:rRNA maturation RNase YbeY [Tetragenococcus halophilus]|uniref:rRNA maturation RNase YbeY n=1 Tax=Tetragenococcus halophilus TaxID=51669 RepID=UPI00209B7AE0|nr:rRNA maturation RNase YbeY [Tetragenococcus halophilus]MCO8292782.1 rRNA maturation RNase YbeY [Tetragenococcus halophilus]